jgi:hypothetical protein
VGGAAARPNEPNHRAPRAQLFCAEVVAFHNQHRRASTNPGDDGRFASTSPTPDSRDTWTASMRHIACEGRCFVLSANQFARRSDYPHDYPIAGDLKPDDVWCRGASMIVSPLGEILAGPATSGEQILLADIHLDQITQAKYDFDVVGHYARADVFRLVVNEASTPPVATLAAKQDPHPSVALTDQRTTLTSSGGSACKRAHGRRDPSLEPFIYRGYGREPSIPRTSGSAAPSRRFVIKSYGDR